MGLFGWIGRLFGRAFGAGGRLLVIDPEPESFALLSTHLKDATVRMHHSATPGDAFEFISRNPPPHAFVIAFRQGDGTSGVETAHLLGQIRTVSRAPVLIVHDRMPEARLLSLKHAVPRAEFVEKPYAGRAMRDRVVAAVKRGQHRPAARTSLSGSGPAIPPPPRTRFR